MSTNFYWKKLPNWFKENAKSPNTNEDGIFMHIGKRSAGGQYCKKCGTTMHKYGTTAIHSGNNPDMGLLLKGIEQQEQAQEYIDKYQREVNAYWYSKCPCCGNDPDYTTSFTWTLMIHKRIIQDNIDNPEKLIVNEYGDGLTCKEFMEECATPVEYQDASEFC